MYSQEEAVALGHNYIGTEHILLGLLKEGEGIGALALQTFRLDVEPFREKVLALVAPMERPGGSSGAPPFTPRAKKVLELSLREALQLGHRYLGWLKDFEGMVGALGPDHVLGELRSLMSEALDK